MTGANLRAGFKLGSLLTVMLILLIPYLGFYFLGKTARRTFAAPFFKYCLKHARIKVTIVGRPDVKNANLFISNHVSYLDIPLLASVLDGLFIAKSEVADWPIIGFLAKISRTHFVSRKAMNIPKEREKIAEHLRKGESIFLFPEGSSGNGVQLLPFKAGLLSAAQSPGIETGTVIQPITLAYGTGKDQKTRDQYAWYGDMDLAPHIWSLLKQKNEFSVSVIFHEAVPSNHFQDRKQLTKWAEERIRTGLTTISVLEQAAE